MTEGMNLEPAFGRVDEYLRGEMKRRGLPGMALGVTSGRGILRSSRLGLADIAGKLPISEGTLFEIGSISKSFASVVALQLAEEGRLDLHAPVTDYLPRMEIKTKHGPITMHHLMSHTAGIMRGTEFTGFGGSEAMFLGRFETSVPPGTYFWYSNSGYKIVGLVLEKVLGARYPEIVTERVLKPLGMSDSCAEITHGLRSRLAVGYAPRFDDRPRPEGGDVVPAPWIESDTADGSISSTAEDMCAYVRMLLGEGAHHGGRLLSKESFVQLTQRAIEPSDAARGEAYGYGLDVYNDEGHEMIGHTGGMIGFTSAMLADASLGLGVVLLTNGLTDTGELARSVMSMLRAQVEGRPGPDVPDPYAVPDAQRYAGRYIGPKGILVLRVEGSRLRLETGAEKLELVPRPPDGFLANNPSLHRFLLKPEEQDGKVVRLVHGQDTFTAEGHRKAKTRRHPRSWLAYTGHYRTYNPWISNFRIVLRPSGLYMIEPSGHEEPLVPIARALFRIGGDVRSPERLKFGQLVNGQALEANVSGCPCFRTFTP